MDIAARMSASDRKHAQEIATMFKDRFGVKKETLEDIFTLMFEQGYLQACQDVAKKLQENRSVLGKIEAVVDEVLVPAIKCGESPRRAIR